MTRRWASLAVFLGGVVVVAACGGGAGGRADAENAGTSLSDPPPAIDDAGTAAPAEDAAAEPAPALPDPSYWENGTTCGTKPEVMLWKYTKSTYIFRQSICKHYETPFNFLFFGKTRAMLLDTGTGRANIRAAVDAAMSDYVAANGITGTYPLFVAHTHSHGDHFGGDGQFRDRPDTTVVGTPQPSVATAFGLAQWPNGTAEFDLGDRVLDVLPLPGHERAHIAVYDRRDRLLFTGDTLYPGRLYIESWTPFKTSIHTLAEWVRTNDIPVAHVLGNHIEMDTTPGHDYPIGAPTHPNEHRLELAIEQLYELDTAVQAMGATPRRERHDDFIVYP